MGVEVAHVVAALYPIIICRQNNSTIEDIFLNRRSVFDKWSLERRKAGNTILGGPRFLIQIDV